jgi:hypothetical protein
VVRAKDLVSDLRSEERVRSRNHRVCIKSPTLYLTYVQSWSDLFLGDQTSSDLTLTSTNCLENRSDLRFAPLTHVRPTMTTYDFVILTSDLRADILRKGRGKGVRSVRVIDCLTR